MKFKRVIWLALLFSLTPSIKAEMNSSTQASFDREFSLRFFIPRHDIGGDFDGNGVYRNGTSVILVPEIDPTWGFGIGGGIKARVQQVAIGVDVALSGASHDTTFSGAKGKAKSFFGDIDLKLFFNPTSKLQPFLLTGLSFSSIAFEDAYFSASEIKNATYSGSGLHAGLGLNYYITPRISIEGLLRHRWLTFDQVDHGDRLSLNPELNAGALEISFGAAYHFNLGS